MNFQITDSLPANTTYVAGSLTVTHNAVNGTQANANLGYTGVGAAPNQNMLTSLPTLPPQVLGVNGIITVTFKTKISPHFPITVISNQATASGVGFPNTNTDNIDSNPAVTLPPGITVPPNSHPQTENLTSIDPTTVLLAAPTATGVFIEGRVIATGGRGLSGVNLNLFDAATGQTRIARTNTFGYFRFVDLEIGNLYTLSASSKRYNFPSGPLTFTLDDNLSGVTFVGVDPSAPAPSGKTLEAATPTTKRMQK